ncbi:hypothetical protein BVRB_4g086990 [Beta vulgaris subsp. vulgaris]|uniref:E2 ubiquitin-conjugating enzyme n=1 Tax=Beta vulgaris subsp. vulgaris TaxID=3555 RepID=A0A0J8FB32_BETVV|nr:hypothetical protein BVRB_4g086990 [Beta vulgaris subsp. vulgaris]
MLNYAPRDKVPVNSGSPFILLEDLGHGSSGASVSFIDDDFEFVGMDLSDTFYDNECAMLQAHFDNVDIPSDVEVTVPCWPFPVGSEQQSPTASGSSVFGTQHNSTVGASDVDQYQPWYYHNPSSFNNSVSKYAFHDSKLPTSGLATDPSSYAQTNDLILPKLEWSLAPGSQVITKPFVSHVTNASSTSTFVPKKMLGSFAHAPSVRLDDDIAAHISPPVSHGDGDCGENSFVKKLERFKIFDTLEDHSGHLYSDKRESCNQSKSWVNKIADEWRMLERDLPATIFVRVYEARMDLLRAAIVGADGTPYHDGLFFFDVNFPLTYPNTPPLVKYHAHGLRINPNLYNSGKVCLSLLGTWSGSREENWRPGKSNMLQVLLSIQGLILNAEPYYNEPGYERHNNRRHGKHQSKNYSENALLLSLKTMLYTMRNPPKCFEDLVFGHFYTHAHDILAACTAYLNGAEVGSFDKTKSPSAEVKKGFKCSDLLKMNLPTYIKSLVEAFTKIGVEDCEKYLVPINESTDQPTKVASSSRRKRKVLVRKGPEHTL